MCTRGTTCPQTARQGQLVQSDHSLCRGGMRVQGRIPKPCNDATDTKVQLFTSLSCYPQFLTYPCNHCNLTMVISQSCDQAHKQTTYCCCTQHIQNICEVYKGSQVFVGRSDFGLSLGDIYRKLYRMLNKKSLNSILNSKFCQNYSFKILFIQNLAKNIHSKFSPLKNYSFKI